MSSGEVREILTQETKGNLLSGSPSKGLLVASHSRESSLW